MKKKRRPLELEQLEARETPDVSLRPAAAYPLGALPAGLDRVGKPPAGQGRPQILGAPAGAEQAESLRASPVPPPTLKSQALESLFLNPGELANLLAGSSGLAEIGEAPQATTPSAGSATASPHSEGTPVRPPEAADGWRFLYNYTRKAIRNEELRYGSLPDHEDILHQVLVEWREQVGSEDGTLRAILKKDTAERQVLRKTVRRVLDRTRYELARQRRTAALFDQPAPARAGEQEWRDLQLDWSSGVGRLSPRQRQLLELRRQGMTFEEIGSEMGLARQRVFELYHSAVSRLRAVYSQA